METPKCALCRYRHNAHLLRDLKSLYDFEPGQQDWAERMASLLVEARGAAAAARQAGQSALDADALENLVTRYRALAADGLAASLYRRTATAKDARRIARRFLHFEDLILRFATRPDLDIFTNDLSSYCTSCGGWRVWGLAGRSGRRGAGGFSIAGESDIFPWCAGASGLAVGVAAA